MEADYYRNRFGDVIDFGPCLVGRNLNLLTLRGFGRLDELAAVSAPDVFDQKLNPTGTQRDLKAKHAQECFAYAMDAAEELAEEAPRCFPELLLNARDANVVELYNIEDPEELFDLNSFSEGLELSPPIVGVRVRLRDITFPKKTVSPQISRVDGNHRLHQADKLLNEAANSTDGSLDREFPPVAFAMLLELNPIQEASLFRDINGEHEGMEVAHLDSIVVRITDVETLKRESEKRPLWIAHELAQPGRAFEDMVFFGGSKEGVKQAGMIPPIRINSLKSTVAQQIRAAPTMDAAYSSKAPEVMLELIDRYWRAVRATFPDAWANKRDYILLQAIGLGGFAKFGGVIIDRCLTTGSAEESDFMRHLEVVKSEVPLERDDPRWEGVAGAGGQDVVARSLLAAAEPEAVKLQKIRTEVLPATSVDDALDRAGAPPVPE